MFSRVMVALSPRLLSTRSWEAVALPWPPRTQNCTSGYIRKPASLVYALSRVPRVAAVEDTVAET